MNNSVKHSDILGTKVSAINMTMTKMVIKERLKVRKNGFVCVAAVHLLMEAYEDKKFQQAVNTSFLITPDGMPLVWLSRVYGHRFVERVYGPDLMEEICLLAEREGYGLFLVGGEKGQGSVLHKALVKKHSNLRICGHFDTPGKTLSLKKNEYLVDQIRKSNAKIIFVGLGCPFQEKWMIENFSRFNGAVCIGVGAAFDFVTGKVKQAPRWMRRIGLEWFWRLFQDPRRLWYRYLVLNCKFIFALIRQVIA